MVGWGGPTTVWAEYVIEESDPANKIPCELIKE